jgi:hypothetical protein
MRLRPGDFEYRPPHERGYRVSGAKLEPSDPYDTKRFIKYASAFLGSQPKIKRKYLRIAIRLIRLEARPRDQRKEVRWLMYDYLGQEYADIERARYG